MLEPPILHEFRKVVRRINNQMQEIAEAISKPFRKLDRQRKEKERERRRQEALNYLERLGADTVRPDVMLNPQTVQWAERAYPHLDNKSSIKDLMRATAKGADASVKTPEKWLQERNPLYKAGRGNNLDKLRRMRRAVLLIVAYFTETP